MDEEEEEEEEGDGEGASGCDFASDLPCLTPAL